ncbi:hypothetical protein ABZ078_10195 [Streptomyces sp. NPDC006385]|uniref:hypothetical protein n=1 Tax=Streptomyces sp. NPDC006385 TaxID=3156761 RepID=UPI0033AB2CC1
MAGRALDTPVLRVGGLVPLMTGAFPAVADVFGVGVPFAAALFLGAAFGVAFFGTGFVAAGVFFAGVFLAGVFFAGAAVREAAAPRGVSQTSHTRSPASLYVSQSEHCHVGPVIIAP